MRFLSNFKAKRNVLLLTVVGSLPFLSSADGEVDITNSAYLLQAKKDQRYISKAPPQRIGTSFRIYKGHVRYNSTTFAFHHLKVIILWIIIQLASNVH